MEIEERQKEIEEDEALELDVFDQAREIELQDESYNPELKQQIDYLEDQLI